jgi:hypothetical protein
MARFDAQIKTALRLIAKNGQAAKWRIVRDGAPVDSSKPWKPSQPATPVEHDVTICFLPITKEMRETIAYLRGTEVTTGSVMGYMGAVDFEPSSKDVVIRDGVEMRIENIDVLSPNGQIILYTAVFKG